MKLEKLFTSKKNTLTSRPLAVKQSILSNFFRIHFGSILDPFLPSNFPFTFTFRPLLMSFLFLLIGQSSQLICSCFCPIDHLVLRILLRIIFWILLRSTSHYTLISDTLLATWSFCGQTMIELCVITLWSLNRMAENVCGFFFLNAIAKAEGTSWRSSLVIIIASLCGC